MINLLAIPDEVIMYRAAELALATFYRALLYVERPGEVRLPERPDAIEHAIAEVLARASKARAPMAQQIAELMDTPIDELDDALKRWVRKRIAAIVDPNFAEAMEVDRKRYDALFERLDLRGAESFLDMGGGSLSSLAIGETGEPIGKSAQALAKGQVRVGLMVKRVHCISESIGEGADDLQAMVTLLGPGGKAAAMPGLSDVGDWDTGDDRNLNLLDEVGKPFGTSLDCALEMGGIVYGAITLFENDDIAPFWRDLAAVVHKLGLIAVYIYVYYETGNEALAAGASELADKVGTYIGEQVLAQSNAQGLGTGVVSLAVLPGKGPTGYVDVHSIPRYESHYRLYFDWRIEGDLGLPIELPEKALEFTPIGKDSHAQVAVCSDGTDMAWVVSSRGAVRRVNGETFEPVTSGYRQVSLGSPARIWAIDTGQVTHRWQSGGFARMTDIPTQVSVGADGQVWGIDRDGHAVYYHDDPTLNALKQWEPVAKLAQVSCGAARTVWGVSTNGAAFQYDARSRGMLQRSAAPALRQVSSASDSTVVAVDDAGTLYMWIPTTTSWKSVPSNVRLQQVANAGRGLLYGLDFEGRLWRWELPGRGTVK